MLFYTCEIHMQENSPTEHSSIFLLYVDLGLKISAIQLDLKLNGIQPLPDNHYWNSHKEGFNFLEVG